MVPGMHTTTYIKYIEAAALDMELIYLTQRNRSRGIRLAIRRISKQLARINQICEDMRNEFLAAQEEHQAELVRAMEHGKEIGFRDGKDAGFELAQRRF
jgi:flagellar biosynthesis/type III secretory pathway protein FliH